MGLILGAASGVGFATLFGDFTPYSFWYDVMVSAVGFGGIGLGFQLMLEN